ncbi:MAG: ATP-binding protein, partial [Lachnospiraceae bacterium]|nr:ATP-binding protein [Lachnospiraceae bacterium]
SIGCIVERQSCPPKAGYVRRHLWEARVLKHVRLHNRMIDPETEIHVAGQIREMLDNLLQNAIRYNKENGAVHVQIIIENGHPMVSVRDTGIGIPSDQQDRVFERFYRVDKSRSRETGGTGLGLAIVKHIAELHSAEIELESVVNKGTKVTIRF